MKLINCKTCNKPFIKIISLICPDCEQQEFMNISHINDILAQNSMATVEQIATLLDLPKNYVKRLQVESRVKIKDRCQTCGKVINTDKWCKECKDKLTKTIGDREKKEIIEDTGDLLSNKERLALENRIFIDKITEIEKEKHDRMYGKRRYGFGIKK